MLLFSKKAFLITNIIVAIGGILFVISKFLRSYETFIIARFLSGLISGLFLGIVPVYISEISPKNLRGITGTMIELVIVSGILATNILGLPQLLGTSGSWPVLMSLCFVPILISLVALFWGVKSPKYLYVKCNDKLGAEKVLVKLRGEQKMKSVHEELEILEEERLTALTISNNSSWSSFLTEKYLYRPLIVAVFVSLSSQFSGINAVSVL